MNKRSILYAGAFILAALVSPAQKFLGHNIRFTPQAFPERNYNEEKYRAQLQEKYSTVIKDQNDKEDFIQAMLVSKRSYFRSNYEYENLGRINEYLQQVAETINSHQNLKIKVRVSRDPSVNACAFEDGTICINMGMLQFLETEAELVAVLGHEITHVAQNHAYIYYKKHLDYLSGAYSSRYSNGGFLIGLAKAKSYSSDLIGYEEDCDAGSAKLLTDAGYNPSGLQELFGLFIKTEEHDRALYGGGKPFLYIRTHPSSESRKKKAIRLCEEKTGRNFIVDSLQFAEMKKMAVDETINLYFEDMEFNECLELAYAQHLLHPDDPFYLFYITECTRRIIAAEPALAGKYFITGSYEHDYDFGQELPRQNPQGLAFTNKSYAPAKKEFFKTVFYRFNEFVKKKHRQNPEHALFRNDTLEFITYQDALDYFKNKNQSLGFGLNNFFFNGTSASSDTSLLRGESILSTTDKEKYYTNLLAANDYYLKKNFSEPKTLVVIYDINYVYFDKKLVGGKGKARTSNDKYSEIVGEMAKSGSAIEFALPFELHFNERNTVYAFLYEVYPFLDKTSFFRGSDKASDQISFDLNGVMPELGALLLNHNYTGIVFSRLDMEETVLRAPLLGGEGRTVSWKVKNFYLDLRKNKINYLADVIAYTHNIGVGGMDMGIIGETDLFGAYFRLISSTIKK
jgi:hypothetical protein